VREERGGGALGGGEEGPAAAAAAALTVGALEREDHLRCGDDRSASWGEGVSAGCGCGGPALIGS